MGIRDEINREKAALLSTKRPYETVAFILFSVLFVYQILVLLLRTTQFFFKASVGWFNLGGTVLPPFFARIVALDSTSKLYALIAFAALFVYYFLVYVLVFNYCKKKGNAKWTWTLIVVFAPLYIGNIFFIHPYILYAVYVFRVYFFRFIKTVIEEYKAFDLNKHNEKEETINKELDKDYMETQDDENEVEA